jgi:DNA (cytosine-5)-methyltransferase 1
MKFIDFFAGIGGFRRGMELAGHECVGFCEFDKFATASYTSMHLLTQEQRESLDKMPLKQRQKEILKEEYRNGEWYANDIRRVYAGDIPKADCWCFGFPCQDISVAGKQAGFQGNRSSLFFRVMYLVGQLKEEDKPTYLFIENVKNLLSVNGGWDFARLLIEMEQGGYDAEWQVLNSKDFGVPQNRERCFIIGHLRGRSTSKIFPIEGTDGKNSVSLNLFGCLNGRNSQRDRVYSGDGLAPTISTKPGGNTESKVAILFDTSYIGQDGTLYAMWHEKYQCYIAIRKLTPKECFRLQGWTDDYFEKAEFVNSDRQLYKQAGNGVTVSVIEAIAKKMEEKT